MTKKEELAGAYTRFDGQLKHYFVGTNHLQPISDNEDIHADMVYVYDHE